MQYKNERSISLAAILQDQVASIGYFKIKNNISILLKYIK
jgi:hypothetical protein